MHIRRRALVNCFVTLLITSEAIRRTRRPITLRPRPDEEFVTLPDSETTVVSIPLHVKVC